MKGRQLTEGLDIVAFSPLWWVPYKEKKDHWPFFLSCSVVKDRIFILKSNVSVVVD
jgi:hypothetical protein